MITLKEKISKLPKNRQKKIDMRARHLIVQEVWNRLSNKLIKRGSDESRD
jgi:hypothetical protein